MNSPKVLRYFTKIVCFSTLFLVFVGSMVTSTGSGLAVPDWPLSYGTLFPPMIGGVFFEHGHRMVAGLVGLMTLVLAVCLAKYEPRKWVRMTGFCALGAVVLQGVLGGITVLLYLPPSVSVLHGVLAQTFLLLTVMLAYSQSNERHKKKSLEKTAAPKFLGVLILLIATIYFQLIIGAIMRHTGSGLAIPDFPKMGGMWVPRFNETMLQNINSWRLENDLDPVNLLQVLIHFVHRLVALIILLQVCFLMRIGLQYYTKNRDVLMNVYILTALIGMQIFLGIATVLTHKYPLITSIHVVNGAATLSFAFLVLLRSSPNSFSEFKSVLCKKQ